MENVIGKEWFKKCFLPNISDHRPQILVLDSHASHEPIDLLDAARDENIVLFTLPSHTTHSLQPFDKTVFSVLKRRYDTECSEFLVENPMKQIDHQNFPAVFKASWEKAATPSTLVSGFRKTGLWPYNPTLVLEDLFPEDAAAVNVLQNEEPVATPQENEEAEDAHQEATVHDTVVAHQESTPQVASQEGTAAHQTPTVDVAHPKSAVTPREPAVPPRKVQGQEVTNGALQMIEQHLAAEAACISTKEVNDHNYSSTSPVHVVSIEQLDPTVVQNPDLVIVPDAAEEVDICSEAQNPVGALVPKAADVVDICAEVQNIFGVKTDVQPRKFGKRRLEVSRVLTSDEIIKQKRDAEEEKQRKLKIKEENKKKREEKKQQKILNDLIKSYTKAEKKAPPKSGRRKQSSAATVPNYQDDVIPSVIPGSSTLIEVIPSSSASATSVSNVHELEQPCSACGMAGSEFFYINCMFCFRRYHVICIEGLSVENLLNPDFKLICSVCSEQQVA